MRRAEPVKIFQIQHVADGFRVGDDRRRAERRRLMPKARTGTKAICAPGKPEVILARLACWKMGFEPHRFEPKPTAGSFVCEEIHSGKFCRSRNWQPRFFIVSADPWRFASRVSRAGFPRRARSKTPGFCKPWRTSAAWIQRDFPFTQPRGPDRSAADSSRSHW